MSWFNEKEPHHLGLGLVCLIITVIIVLVLSSNAKAQTLPPNAVKYLPDLVAAMDSMQFPYQLRHSIAGQVEQETCPSAKHSKCWNPKAELNTKRELGIGLGQVTIAYREDGSERFNLFKELTARPELKDWKWEDRYNPYYQIKAILVLNRMNYVKLQYPFENEYEKMAAMFASYNGGFGDVMKSRLVCLKHPTCPSKKWFDGIETTNVKSERKFIYGRSPREINNEYPRNIMKIRMGKYEPFVPTEPIVSKEIPNTPTGNCKP